MFRLRFFCLLVLLSVLGASLASPLYIRRAPLLIKRITQPRQLYPLYNDEDDVVSFTPYFRKRRSQPVLDYTDEFSADPFDISFPRGPRGDPDFGY